MDDEWRERQSRDIAREAEKRTKGGDVVEWIGELFSGVDIGVLVEQVLKEIGE